MFPIWISRYIAVLRDRRTLCLNYKLDVYLTLQVGRRAAVTGEHSVKPYPFWTFMSIACRYIDTSVRDGNYKSLDFSI